MPRELTVKSVLNKTKKRDSWFLDDYTVNLYSSCSFNCLYCYIRGSKYGTNLAENISIKSNAIEVLDRQLFHRAKKEQYGIIVLSSATDPYLNLEEKYQLTRDALKIILKYKFPVHMITKSNGIVRDFDILHAIDKAAILPVDLKDSLQRGCIISYSFSTVDDAIGKIFEPGATQPSERIKTVKKTKQEGFLSGISMMPLLPFISDTTAHLTKLFETFKACKVDYVLPATLTLFGNEASDSKPLVLKAIQQHFPELEQRYLKYFSQSNELPKYYRDAFYKKMNELCHQYDIPNRII